MRRLRRATTIALLGLTLACGAAMDGCEIDTRKPVKLYHVPNYATATSAGGVSLHGLDTNTGAEDCRGCHGEDLTGGEGPAISCDNAGCHVQTWRSDCQFCHGPDQDNLFWWDNNKATTRTQTSFGSHLQHLGERIAPGAQCETCHTMPSDILSPGHVFDETPGIADVIFGALNDAAGYDAANESCDNLYCHGDGQIGGVVANLDPSPGCDSCHADLSASSQSRWPEMSGSHNYHLLIEQVSCTDCHASVAKTNGTEIVASGVLLHLNGAVDVELLEIGGPTLTWDPGEKTCDGACHNGGDHAAEAWD